MLKYIKTNSFTIIFAVIMFLMFAGYLFGRDGEFSQTENRYLAKRPMITFSGLADGSFMESFELFTEEQLPFRDKLIRLKAVCGELLLKNENNGIARGKDGRLFEKLIRADKQLDKNRAAVLSFCQKTDRDINICIVPNSYEILKDDIPRGFPGISQKEIIDGFYEELRSCGSVNTIDLYEELSENADEYIYYRTDHHWTTEGAYCGYRKLCSEMELVPVDISAQDMKDKLKSADGFYGTYQAKYRGMLGVSSDTISYYDIPVSNYKAGDKMHDTMYDLEKLDTYDKYAMFMYGNEGLSVVDAVPDNKSGRRGELILFKDSYGNCMIPFFTYNYDRVTMIDLRYYPGSVKQLLKEHEDADILLMYNFMHFNEDNHFYRLTS